MVKKGVEKVDREGVRQGGEVRLRMVRGREGGWEGLEVRVRRVRSIVKDRIGSERVVG